MFEAAGQHRGYSIFFESSPDRFQSVRRKIAEAIAKAHPSDGMIAGTPEDLLREAERLVAAGSWRAALFKAKDALFLDETNFEAGEMELVCYRRLGMRTETAEAALWLVRRHSSSAEAYRVLGDAYAWNARLDEACEAYQQALDKGLAGKEAERVEALLRENRFPQPGTAAFRLALPDVRPGEERGINRGIGLAPGTSPPDSTIAGRTCALLLPDIGKTPRGRVVRAWMEYRFRRNAEDRLFAPVYTAYPILVPWDPATVTWFQRSDGVPWAEPGAGKPGVDGGELTSPMGSSIWEANGTEGVLRIDITGMMRDWLTGAVPYHGLGVVAAYQGVPLERGELVVWYVPDPAAPKAVEPTKAPPAKETAAGAARQVRRPGGRRSPHRRDATRRESARPEQRASLGPGTCQGRSQALRPALRQAHP